MKFFSLICLLSFAVFAEDWQESIAELAPELVIDAAHNNSLSQELQKSFEKNSAVAFPFKSPVGSIKFVQDKGVKTLEKSASFKQGVHHQGRDYAVYRYSTMVPKDMKILAKIQYGKLFKTYLNGKSLAQHENGMLYHRESPYQTLSLRKGRNDLVFISITKDHHIPHLRTVPYTDKVIEGFYKYLNKFNDIKDVDLEEWLGIQLALRNTGLIDAQVHGLTQILTLDYKKVSQGRIRHFFHLGIDPRVMAQAMSKIDTQKLVDLMIYINHPHIKSYFDVLAIEGRGKEIVHFFNLYAKKYKAKSGYSWGNNLYGIAEFLLMQGDTKSAHEMFLLFDKVAEKKNSSTKKNIEYALLESQDDSGVRPRFTADPEVEVYVNDLDRLFKQKADRDTLAQVYKTIREHQDKLFSSDYQLYSLKTYFQQKLTANPDFAEKFSAYLKERYESRVNKAIENFDIDRLQGYLRETSGFASFPEAEALLMQEYYNRGDLSIARAYAGRLLQYADFAKQAAAYLFIIEGTLETPEKLRHEFSNDLLGSSVQFKGQSIQLKELAANSLPKASSSKGPGSLISKIPLSTDLKSTIDGRTSQYDWDQYFINRSQCKVIYNSGQWFSSSPMGTEVSDSKGQQLWSTYSFTPLDTRIQNAPRSFKGTVINNFYYNLNYNGASKTFALQKRDLQGELQWDSSYLQSFKNWEPCSIPYSKMGSQIILLVERDRQAAPVFAVAFIDLQSGELESVKSLAKIRDPFQEEGRYDIFRSLLQYDNFCDDRESIYLYSGSGLVVKVNAYEKRIEWVRSYTYKTRKNHEGDSFDWTNPARTASPFIGIVKDKLIHFDNATMSWYALDPETGKILWKNPLDLPSYIHSRDADEIIFSHLNRRGQHTLKSLSLSTGRVMWQQNLGNLSVRGEGAIKNNKLYLPVKRGLVSFDLNKKELIARKLLNISPSAIESHKDKFLLYTEKNAFLLASDDQLPSTIDDKAQPKDIAFEKADEVDLKFFSNDGLITFPLTDIYFKERPVAHSLDNSAYSLIQYLSDYILIKEATLVNGEYSPSRLLWQKRMPNLQLKGSKILNYSSGSVEIMDAYTLQSEFTYKASNGEIINAARWSDDHLYILSSNGSLKQLNFKSKKLIKEFQLYARDFVVLGNRLLTFPQNPSHKNKVYELTDKLTELKTLDKAYRMGDQLQGNSFAQGWLSHGALHVFDFKQLKMHQKKMGYTPHRSWRLCEKYAAENFGELLDLSNGSFKKHNFNLLGNKGSIYGQGNDYYYASNRGLMKLERFTDKIKVFDDHLTKGRKVIGWCREVGDLLIVCSSKIRNVYDLKSAELISRQSIDGSQTEKTILTDHSLIKVHNGNAYLYNSLKLSNATIAYSSAKIDALFWQKVDKKFWHGKSSYPMPQVEYRLSDSSKYIHLQLRLKGHEKFVNHLGLSLNSHRFHDTFFAEFTEKGNNIGHMLGNKLKEPFKHYFSADGYEYMELKVEKPDTLNNAFDGVMSFELSLLDQGNKVGSMRFGSTYQPNTSYRENTYSARSYVCMDAERYAKFEKLYAEATELLADGNSLSQFIKARRTHHSVSSNVTYLEKLLAKHNKSVQVHNILSVLFIEYLKSLKAFDFTDEDLRKAYSYGKSLADKHGLKNYERALSFVVFDFNSNENPYIQPTRAKLAGRGDVTLDLSGSLQFSTSDGRVVLPMGFFGDQLKELDHLEFDSPRRFKPALGSMALFHKGNLTAVIDSQGKAQSGLKEINWKNAHESLFNFYGPNRLKSWFPKANRIRVQKIAFDALETKYNWDENSLLLNLSSNPVNRWRADEMLRKYIELKGSSDLVELCSEILASDPNNEHLLEAILSKYGENAGKDLKKYQSLMSKARVPVNLRKTMSLELFADQDFLQLGPIKLEESNVELLQKPEENFSKSSFKLSNETEHKFEPQKDNGKDYEGFMYLRKEFDSTSSSNAYLHIKPERRRTAFNNLRIWHNGKVLFDTIINTEKNQATSLKIPLRKGKNSILIKYSFEHYTNLKLKLGNVYGGNLSYISN